MTTLRESGARRCKRRAPVMAIVLGKHDNAAVVRARLRPKGFTAEPDVSVAVN